MAAAGPLFVAVIVKVTFEPTSGVPLLTVLVIARSVQSFSRISTLTDAAEVHPEALVTVKL